MSTPPFLELPAGVRATRLPTPRGELAALSAEPARTTGAPVLLVPGYTGSKEDFIAVLAPIAAAGHRVMALDQRGQFESPGDDDPSSYDVKVLADDVLAVLAGLGAPAHLVGHSFGGLVARAAALADPAALRSLTLMSSGPAAIPAPANQTIGAARPGPAGDGPGVHLGRQAPDRVADRDRPAGARDRGVAARAGSSPTTRSACCGWPSSC